MLRERLEKSEIVVAPGAQNALFARLIEEFGFEAIYATGAGIANLHLGWADLGLTTMTEVVETVRRMTDVVSVPVIADIDTGFGNQLNVWRTIREFENAGVAAVQIEDQVFPKRCGHFAGKDVIPREEMLDKICAAKDARKSDDFLIIARTDAGAVHGFEQAIERANAYAAAGADLLFVEAPPTEEELRRVPKEVDGKVVANMVEGGKTPLFSAQALEEMGYSLVLFANATQKAAIRGLERLLGHLSETGETWSEPDLMISMERRNEITGLHELRRKMEGYGPEASR
ncbi:MAG: isocitrate lyase/PEP mutase family protein [Synergistales bacterium]|nr:isocitrate lyase/PEP mutase family protein [Synergistales bacterium]